jgi:hypothetical protein
MTHVAILDFRAKMAPSFSFEGIFRGGATVAQLAVNELVVGSNPTRGASQNRRRPLWAFFVAKLLRGQDSNPWVRILLGGEFTRKESARAVARTYPKRSAWFALATLLTRGASEQSERALLGLFHFRGSERGQALLTRGAQKFVLLNLSDRMVA